MTGGRFTILDAAIGTRLIEIGLDLHGDDPCLWVERKPEQILALHQSDIHAGARIVTTDTFGANRHWLSKFGRAADADRINRAAVGIAREAFREASSEGRVAGCVGPTALVAAGDLRHQIDSLRDAGADLILLETLTADEALRACRILDGIHDLPVWMTLWNWGGDPASTARELADHGIAAWGVNCVADQAEIVRVFATLHASGLAASILKSSIASIAEFVHVAKRVSDFGGHRFGGCCGTNHLNIAELCREFAE